jgi:hypothetical protein
MKTKQNLLGTIGLVACFGWLAAIGIVPNVWPATDDGCLICPPGGGGGSSGGGGSEPTKCADPAAYQIEFKAVSATNACNPRLRIAGVIKNVGSTAFQSSPPRVARLFEDQTLVAEQAFDSLDKGKQFALQYEIDWDKCAAELAGTAPTYSLQIDTCAQECYCENNSITWSLTSLFNLTVFLSGDVNGDWVVNEADLSLVDAALAGTDTLSAEELGRSHLSGLCSDDSLKTLKKNRKALAKYLKAMAKGSTKPVRDRCHGVNIGEPVLQ